MDFLPSYDQVDHHPRHHYGRGEDNYPPPVNLSPYSPSLVGSTYDDGPYPPPPSYRNTYDQPPPPPREYNSTPSPYGKYQNYPPPPPPSSYAVDDENNHHFNPHMPAFVQGQVPSFKPNYNTNTNSIPNKINNYVSDGVGLVGPKLGFPANMPSYKIYCKAGGERFAVAIRDGKVVLTRPDTSDPTQRWYKDERYSTRVKDEEGNPSFILVNKATAQAVKHSVVGHPVQLIPYKPDVMDGSILWTESKDLGSGFRTIRPVNNVRLVMDAWNADKDHGGIHDGTIVAVYKCWKGDNQNQQWKLVPY
ncbi:ricin B-like lectin R40C1 [Silene latifolia]|uniref:ricin B-like lectin R40C1 n=1 Tax=Silene latifolia TaxID=37657 RepID=UPI003D76AE3B